MCDLLDAAEALEPGGRLRAELRQACSRAAAPRPSAAETAAAKAFADGGACAMLAHFPTLAAQARALPCLTPQGGRRAEPERTA